MQGEPLRLAHVNGKHPPRYGSAVISAPVPINESPQPLPRRFPSRWRQLSEVETIPAPPLVLPESLDSHTVKY